CEYPSYSGLGCRDPLRLRDLTSDCCAQFCDPLDPGVLCRRDIDVHRERSLLREEIANRQVRRLHLGLRDLTELTPLGRSELFGAHPLVEALLLLLCSKERLARGRQPSAYIGAPALLLLC